MFKNVRYITTVLTPATATPPAGPYDLTNLATAKVELGIPTSDTTNDAFLSNAITQESAAIASYCNRVFAVEGIQDVIYLEREIDYRRPRLEDLPIQLTRWPVVQSVPAGSFTGNTHDSTLVDGIASTALLYQGLPVTGTGVAAGTTIAAVNDATSVTLSAATTGGPQTGVTFSTGIGVLQTIVPGVPTVLVPGTDYVIDPLRGWLMPPSPYAASALRYLPFWVEITVQYSAGFQSIPADIVKACLRLVTMRFKSKGRDPLIKMERDGGTSHGSEVEYWVGTTPGQEGALPPEVASLCDHYRVYTGMV